MQSALEALLLNVPDHKGRAAYLHPSVSRSTYFPASLLYPPLLLWLGYNIDAKFQGEGLPWGPFAERGGMNNG